MIAWADRSREEKWLLNPAFCANIIWHAAVGYASVEQKNRLSFEESFLVLPIVLHRETREELPRTTRTSLTVWLDENALARGRVANGARLLVPFTKDALTFAGMYDIIRIVEGRLQAQVIAKNSVKKALDNSSDEVRNCAKQANFVGKWFAQAGSSATVLALIGVRP